MEKANQLSPTNQKHELAVSPPPSTNMIIPSDVIVPRILLMQGTSDFVKERKANLGDIVKSTTLEVLGGPDKMVEFIALTEPTTGWRVEKRPAGAQRWEFSRSEPRSAINDHLPWKFNADKDGRVLEEGQSSTHEWRRIKTLSLYAILPSDIESYSAERKKAEEGELPDLSKALSPVLIDFRSTSFNAGKEVSTFFTQVQQFKATSWKYILKLGCFLDKNDQGSFYVYKVDRNGAQKVKAEHLPDVEYWVNIVKSTTLTVDEEAIDSAVETAGKY